MSTPTLTFRVAPDLQKRANAKARKLGIPLTAVLRNALVEFTKQDTITFQNEEGIEVLPLSSSLQQKLDRAMDNVHRAVRQKQS